MRDSVAQQGLIELFGIGAGVIIAFLWALVICRPGQFSSCHLIFIPITGGHWSRQPYMHYKSINHVIPRRAAARIGNHIFTVEVWSM